MDYPVASLVIVMKIFIHHNNSYFSCFGFIVQTNRHADRITYRVAQKTGPPYHCKYSVAWHLAKTELPSFIHIVQIDLSITQ